MSIILLFQHTTLTGMLSVNSFCLTLQHFLPRPLSLLIASLALFLFWFQACRVFAVPIRIRTEPFL